MSVFDVRAAASANAVCGVIGVSAFAVLLISGVWTLSHPPLTGLFSDSVDYLIFADFYRQSFGGEVNDIVRHQYAATRFPPLYPLLLAAFGAGLDSTLPAFSIQAALLLAWAALAVWWHFRETASFGAALALLPVAAVTPQLVTWFILPLSEPLFVALLIAILLTSSLCVQRSIDVMVVALLVALLPFARSAGIAITAAFLIWLIAIPGVSARRRITAACIAVLPVLLWTIYRATQPVVLAYDDQISLEQIIQRHGSLAAFLVDQASAVARGWHAWLDLYRSKWTLIPAFALVAVAAVGWWSRLWAWKLDALILPAYLGMILIWPFPAEMPRLVGVMAPLIALCAYDGVLLLARTVTHSGVRLAPVFAAIALGVLGLMTSASGWWLLGCRASAEAPAELVRYKRWQGYLIEPNPAIAGMSLETMAHVLGMLNTLPETISRSECVYTQLPAFVWVQTRGVVRSRGLPLLDGARPIEEQLPDCEYVLALNLRVPQLGTPPLYPLAFLDDRARPVLVSKFQVAGGEVLAAALMRMERTSSGSSE